MSAARASAFIVFAGCMLGGLALLADDGPRRYSDEWFEERANDMPGSRQKYKYGKLWPPFPRPTGKGQPFWHKYHHAHYWPQPYVCEDRAYVNDLIAQQSLTGWANATTLHDMHFDPETHRLNSSGESHLNWILNQAPVQYRAVFVAQTNSPQVSQVRVEQVRHYAEQVCGANLPPILLKYDAFLGRPAIEIDTLRRLELQSIPQPRLFTVGPASGSNSSTSPSSSQAGGSTGGQSGGATSIR
jgi:hypothetical protein